MQPGVEKIHLAKRQPAFIAGEARLLGPRPEVRHACHVVRSRILEPVYRNTSAIRARTCPRAARAGSQRRHRDQRAMRHSEQDAYQNASDRTLRGAHAKSNILPIGSR